MGTSCVKSKPKDKPSKQVSGSKFPVSRNDRESLSEKLGLFILYDSNITSDILNYYDFGPIIGHGSFGNVRIATRKLLRARQQYAVKSIPKSRVKSDIRLLQRELRILKLVDHPNIIKLHDIYEDPKFLHLVQEYCSGGELFEKIVDRGNYTENEASNLMYKLFHAINHLHNQNICHRDIKPENILYKSKDPNSEIKLIDFGLSYKFGEAEEMHTIVGTSYYVAPEVLEKRYGMECDIWSLGVILYLLLAGKPPFAGSDKNDIFNKIQNCEYSMDDEVWRSVSSEAKDIIGKLICRNPKDRLTAAQAMEHPWFAKININTNERTLDRTVLRRLQRYKAGSKLRTELMRVLVKYLSQQEIECLTDLFRKLDKDHTGYVKPIEIQRALKRMGIEIAQTEIEDILKNTTTKGKINYTDFLIATLDTRSLTDDETIWAAFKYFDHVTITQENTGHITYEKIKEAFQRAGKNISDDELEMMLAEAGISHNQVIDFSDFQRLIKRKPYSAPDSVSRRGSNSSLESVS